MEIIKLKIHKKRGRPKKNRKPIGMEDKSWAEIWLDQMAKYNGK